MYSSSCVTRPRQVAAIGIPENRKEHTTRETWAKRGDITLDLRQRRGGNKVKFIPTFLDYLSDSQLLKDFAPWRHTEMQYNTSCSDYTERSKNINILTKRYHLVG